LAGLRGEESIAALCRREGISESLYYGGPRNFSRPANSAWPGVEGTVAPVGPRKPLNARQATSPEVKELRSEAAALKEVVADLILENRLVKKSMIGGEPWSGSQWMRH
jgi:transposase